MEERHVGTIKRAQYIFYNDFSGLLASLRKGAPTLTGFKIQMTCKFLLSEVSSTKRDMYRENTNNYICVFARCCSADFGPRLPSKIIINKVDIRKCNCFYSLWICSRKKSRNLQTWRAMPGRATNGGIVIVHCFSSSVMYLPSSSRSSALCPSKRKIRRGE